VQLATSQWAFLGIKFFSLFLKADFVFSRKKILQAVDITKPSVEKIICTGTQHRRFANVEMGGEPPVYLSSV
jgi:hypothetical protein